MNAVNDLREIHAMYVRWRANNYIPRKDGERLFGLAMSGLLRIAMRHAKSLKRGVR